MISILIMSDTQFEIFSTYLIVTSIVTAIIATLHFIKSESKDKSVELKEIFNKYPEIQELAEFHKALQTLNKDGTEEDVMPEGYGEFGLEVTNPIPTNTVFGSYFYLGRLRTMDGKKIEYNRVGQVSAPNIISIIDEYDIFLEDKKIASIYLCPYNKKNSVRAPKNFKLYQPL